MVLVALPLCLGIALASGAPRAAIVVAGITALGSFEAFLAAVVIGGVLQIALSLMRAGIIGHFIPSAVIKGMLAAIGVILIIKQLPHAVGYDADFEGDETFAQTNAENTLSALVQMLEQIQLGAVVIASAALASSFPGAVLRSRNSRSFPRRWSSCCSASRSISSLRSSIPRWPYGRHTSCSCP